MCADGLGLCLANLRNVDAADALKQEARELVWPQQSVLLDCVDRLQTLRNVVCSRPSERVLCHGDLIGDNLLRDRGGWLWLVDWDSAVLAPRELDVGLFTGSGSRTSSTVTSASPAAGTSTRTRSRSFCCAAASMTWSTGCNRCWTMSNRMRSAVPI